MIQSLVLPVSVCLSLTFISSMCSGSLIVNSNAIKSSIVPGHQPGAPLHGGRHAASSSPDAFGLLDGGYHNLLIDPIQALTCSADDECGEHGFCFASRGACLPCKRRRKRCARDAMCCPGNQCSNGVCLPVDVGMVQQFTVEEIAVPSTTASSSASSLADRRQEDSSTTSTEQQTKEPILTNRGLEGERCLRSADCDEGLCCARHFWSKICKPVLREGQVCTKHRKKGALGLEIFQRCDCGEGLACRTQKGVEELRLHKAMRTLHTCQRH